VPTILFDPAPNHILNYPRLNPPSAGYRFGTTGLLFPHPLDITLKRRFFMKTEQLLKILLVLNLLILGIISTAPCETNCTDMIQDEAVGSVYRICMPTDVPYNGKLVIWAHGFQDATDEVSIPEDQLQFGDFSIPEIITDLGYGFATNSYSKTGLAVVQGVEDIVELVDLFADYVEAYPERVFLTGASEGGLITTRLIETRPDLFDAGFAACGPIGDFPYQIKYFGDARATFQYFFPHLIPGDPFNPSDYLIANWKAFYDSEVRPVVFSPMKRGKLDQWVNVAKLPFDSNNKYSSLELTVKDVLRYSVVNIKDAAETIGGFPFDNRRTWYFGSNNDFFLNLFVPRISATPSAVTEMKTNYNTSGGLDKPLITMHTLYDQQVPYVHELLYNLKTMSNGTFLTKHINIPINRFGHCNFEPEEAILGFGLMLLYAGEMDTLEGVGTLLQGDRLNSFENYSDKFGLPYSKDGDKLSIK
jgi:pimeloyl-ACP methyl ester carboxylesterase